MLLVALETAGSHLHYLPYNLWGGGVSLNSCLFSRRRNSPNYVTRFILLFTKTSECVQCCKPVEICPLLSTSTSTHLRSGFFFYRSLFITELLSTLRCAFLASSPYIIILYLTLRRLMSYIYGAPILDVSRSHTTTQHSR